MKKQDNNAHIIFLLTPEQWIGVAILTLITIGTILLLHLFPKPPTDEQQRDNDSTLSSFTQHQAQQDSIHKAQWRRQYQRDTIAIYLQPFDPNTADSTTLVHLGLKPWQARNMLRYRDKGGRYKQPQDLKRLYGMTDSLYNILAPYIRITLDTLQADTNRLDTIYPRPAYTYTVKRDTVLNLRTADTTELQLIRGIGRYTAREIIRYRTRLGGFTNTRQLLEIPACQQTITRRMQQDSLYTADSLLRHFYIDSIIVTQLPVNHMRPDQLQQHPYISFTQAQAIYELRRQHVRLHSIQQLSSIPCLTPTDLQRLTPYLLFND